MLELAHTVVVGVNENKAYSNFNRQFRSIVQVNCKRVSLPGQLHLNFTVPRVANTHNNTQELWASEAFVQDANSNFYPRPR
jgi:hypothetical protein